MSFDKEMYTCKICGRIDFSAERFVHVCPEHVKEKTEEKGENVTASVNIPKEDIRVNGC